MTASLHPVMFSHVDRHVSHGAVRSKIWCLFLQPRRSTKQVLLPHKNACGFDGWLMMFIQKFTNQLLYMVTTKVLSSLRQIRLHIEIEHHSNREKVLDETIEVLEVRSNDNVAGIFSKSLSKGPFEFFRRKLGAISRKSH